MGPAKRHEPSNDPHQHDPTFTDRVIAATGPKADTRLAEIMPSLIRHLHDFARESNVTVAEWTAGVEFINECGRMSDHKRNETQLLCDILGLESLVDEVTARLLGGGKVTPSAILGPFYRHGAPDLPNGTSIVRELSPSVPWYERAIEDAVFVYGRVFSSPVQLPGMNGSNGTNDEYETGGTDNTNGTNGDHKANGITANNHANGTHSPNGKAKPPTILPGATVDVWHTAPNGLYEQQDPSQPDMNLRGRFTTDASGRFSFYALRPVPYPVPDDGPAGRLLGMLDRRPFRPAHIHFIVEAAGHKTLVTQVFDAEDEFLRDDSVFAVKEELVVRFVGREGDPRARWELEYDFVLGQDGERR